MKAAFHTDTKKIEIKKIEIPKPGKGEYLIKIKACAICGSDTWWLEKPAADTTVHGHESTGKIVECGEDTSRFTKGDKVVCYAIKGCGKCHYCRIQQPTNCSSKQFIENGFQEYAVFDEELLFACPDGFDFKTASLLSDAIGVPLRGLRRLPLQANDSVAVWGLGPLGLLQVMFLKAKGVKNIIGIDTIDYRLQTAKKIGANVTLNPKNSNVVEKIKEHTDGIGCDKAFIYVRHPKVTEDVFNSTKVDSEICTFVGLDGQYQLQEWFERTLVWSFYFAPPEYSENLEFIKKNNIDIGSLITDTYPLSQINDAFIKKFDNPGESIKIVILMD